MTLPFFLSGISHFNGADIPFHWFLGVSIAVIYASILIYGRTDFLPALLFGYFSLQMVYLNFYQGGPYVFDVLGAEICRGNLVSFISFAWMVFLALNFRALDVRGVRVFLPWLGVFNSCYVIFGAITGKGILTEGVGYSGFFNYAGMNAVLICLSIPYLLKKTRTSIFSMAICLIAIALSKSSIPYGVLTAMIAAYVICKKRTAKKMAICLSVVPMLLGVLFERRHLFNSAYRFQAYKVFMGAWWRNSNQLIGTGLGTFPIIERAIQINTGFMAGPPVAFFWPSLHSDWLQVLFEGGFIGLAIVAALFLHSAYLLYQKENSEALSVLMGIASSAVFDFPMRYMILSFLTVFCLSEAYLGEKHE